MHATCVRSMHMLQGIFLNHSDEACIGRKGELGHGLGLQAGGKGVSYAITQSHQNLQPFVTSPQGTFVKQLAWPQVPRPGDAVHLSLDRLQGRHTRFWPVPCQRQCILSNSNVWGSYLLGLLCACPAPGLALGDVCMDMRLSAVWLHSNMLQVSDTWGIYADYIHSPHHWRF